MELEIEKYKCPECGKKSVVVNRGAQLSSGWCEKADCEFSLTTNNNELFELLHLVASIRPRNGTEIIGCPNCEEETLIHIKSQHCWRCAACQYEQQD